MSHGWAPEADRSGARAEVVRYVRPLRVTAVFVAVAAAGWELTSRGLDPLVLNRLIILRAIETVVAIGVAWAASPRRSLSTLRALVWILALDVALANIAVMWIQPTATTEALLVQAIVILGAGGLAPWSWRDQLTLALVLLIGSGAALLAFAPETILPGPLRGRALLSLLTLSLMSVLVTALRNLDQRLIQQSEARYRNLFRGAGDAVAVLDAAGRVRDANPRLEELLGRPLASLLGEPLAPLVHCDGADEAMPTVPGAVAATGETRVTGGRVRRPDGTTREVECVLTRVPGTAPPSWQVVIRDLSDRRALERRQAEERRIEAVSRLAGALAHQFNNLLGGILNEASLLKDEVADPEMQAGLERIRETARRGAQLTDTMIRLTPSHTVTTVATSATELTRLVADRVGMELPAARVAFDVPHDLPPMAADISHLTDAVIELIRNAVDALGGRDAPVSVAAAVERVSAGDRRWTGALPGVYVRLSVVDRGAGMDASTRNRLFEPFFSSRAMHQSVGLGLATVYWVIRAHRGGIAVESEPGEGTGVHLLIPVAAQPGRSERAPGTRPTVLVADDEDMNRRTVVRALERFGYAAVAVNDGAAALEAVRKGAPTIDAVILDVVMPGSGPELVRRIREAKPEIGILVCSGYGPEGAAADMLKAGARGFLGKPFELPELRDSVAGVLA